ncbi:hypothetical protein BOH72_01435 [Mycobacterium sp. WY10]|nr:hypothetical protein BOH72_01435 [Mycobacterium sp. WY10]
MSATHWPGSVCASEYPATVLLVHSLTNCDSVIVAVAVGAVVRMMLWRPVTANSASLTTPDNRLTNLVIASCGAGKFLIRVAAFERGGVVRVAAIGVVLVNVVAVTTEFAAAFDLASGSVAADTFRDPAALA